MTDEEFEREKERDREIEERRGKKDSSRSRSRCATTFYSIREHILSYERTHSIMLE